jgi:hypothetical protein
MNEGSKVLLALALERNKCLESYEGGLSVVLAHSEVCG